MIENETESFINKAKHTWLEGHATTLFLEEAKTVLKKDFFDILENLRLPGKPAENSWSLIKMIINPFLALTGTTGIGIGAGLIVLSINPPAGIAMAIGGGAIGGVFLSRVITDSEKECEKALQNLTEECLRKYIRTSKQAGINKCLKTFFEVDVIEKIAELKKLIQKTKEEVNICKTKEATLKSLDLEITKFSNRLEDMKH